MVEEKVDCRQKEEHSQRQGHLRESRISWAMQGDRGGERRRERRELGSAARRFKRE